MEQELLLSRLVKSLIKVKEEVDGHPCPDKAAINHQGDCESLHLALTHGGKFEEGNTDQTEHQCGDRNSRRITGNQSAGSHLQPLSPSDDHAKEVGGDQPCQTGQRQKLVILS